MPSWSALERARRKGSPPCLAEAARALLQFIVRSVPRAEQGAMRAELRVMLVAYLAPVLGE